MAFRRRASWAAGWLAVLGACAPPPRAGGGPCEAEPPPAGEVRARRIGCDEELLVAGEARVSDWLLENDRVRFRVLDAGYAVHRLDAAGGVLADGAPWGQDGDAVAEATPLPDGAPFRSVAVEPVQGPDGAAGLRLDGRTASGAVAAFTWWLDPGADGLRLDGATAMDLVVPWGTSKVGELVEISVEAGDRPALVLGSDAPWEDLGGWLRLTAPTALWMGSRPDVVAARWPSRQRLQGESDGRWVEARAAGRTLLRVPVVDGRFDAEIPAEVDEVRADAAGFAAGPWAPPGEGLLLPVGPEARLQLRVADETGRPLPATAFWDGRPAALPGGQGEVQRGPGTAPLVVFAGPLYEAADLGDVEIDGVTERAVTLRAASPGAAVVDFGVRTWPDRLTRADPAAALRDAQAAGATLAVAVADDEVGRTASLGPDARGLLATAGTRARGDGWSILAFPWARDSRRPGSGALDLTGFTPAVAVERFSRAGAWTVVDAGWLAAAGDPLSWVRRPDFLALDGIDALPQLLSVWDRGVALAPVGPWTLLPAADPADPSPVPVVRALETGDTVASTGPWARLWVSGAVPGEDPPAWAVHRAVVACSAPAWAPLRRAVLLGPGGVELASAPASGPQEATVAAWVPPGLWWAGLCEGAEDSWLTGGPVWALTAPVFGGAGADARGAPAGQEGGVAGETLVSPAL